MKKVITLIALLIGCDSKRPVPPRAQDPTEAKKMRLAEISRKIQGAPEESKKLSQEADALVLELAGKDVQKQNALWEEVYRRYRPDDYSEFVGKQKAAKAKAGLRNIQMALDRYYLDQASYPVDLGELVKPGAERLPYVENERDLIDPWGRPYFYRKTEAGRYELKSLGADGHE